MNKTNLSFLTVTLASVFILSVNAEEPRPSLKQLIAESTKRDGPWGGYPSPNFSPHQVRKHFYGDEAAFQREVIELLQSGKDDWSAHTLIMFLDIGDETTSKILRERFASADAFYKDRFFNLLARHRIKENLEFLVGILECPDHSVSLRASVAYYLSYFQRRYFEEFDAELKNRIVNAFLACLDDGREVHYRFGEIEKVGNTIAHQIGYFGRFAKSALPKIKEKFISVSENETDIDLICTKLQLAWSIVRIAPEQSENELKYILQNAVEHKSKDVRWEAITLLETVPVSLAERVIPVLCTVIQKETSLSNKVWAADALKAILSEQEMLIDPFDEECDDANEINEFPNE